MADTRATKFLIIGSGVAGGLLAERLLAGGQGPVTMLEAGAPVVMGDARHWIDHVTTGALPYENAEDRPEDFDAEGEQPWYIAGGRLFARGGSTLHWGGWCPRMKPEDFELQSRVGTGGLDWPISYEKLEPYYERAERYLQVAGDSSDADPPRRQPFPLPAAPFTANDRRMIRAMDQLGISHAHMPVARNALPINGRPQCMTYGTCDYCPQGARFTGDQPLDRLRDAARRGTFSLLTRSSVQRLLVDAGDKRKIRAVEYRDLATGDVRRLEAETVLLCAGAIETPKLLLASAGPPWPAGVGNETDQVGRHLIANPFFYARGRRTPNPEALRQELHFVTLCSRHWDSPAHQREGKFLLAKSSRQPDIKLAEEMAQGRDGAALRRLVSASQPFELVGTVQCFSYPENRIQLAAGSTRFGVPRTRIHTPRPGVPQVLEATVLGRMSRILEAMGYPPIAGRKGQGSYPQRGDHAMCTARISESPGDGVVDANLRVHGTDNLYILSNAVFPSGMVANPTLTLAALGFRLADHLCGERCPSGVGSAVPG